MELRLGLDGLCGRSADSKNCELFGATARGQPVQPTLDMAMVAWGSGVLGARRDGSSSINFVRSMPAGIRWPLKGRVVASGDTAIAGRYSRLP